MNDTDITEKLKFLTSFLDMPPSTRTVGSLRYVFIIRIFVCGIFPKSKPNKKESDC
jgi:hypothetical protein